MQGTLKSRKKILFLAISIVTIAGIILNKESISNAIIQLANRKFEVKNILDSGVFYDWTAGEGYRPPVLEREKKLKNIMRTNGENVIFNIGVINFCYVSNLTSKWKHIYTRGISTGGANLLTNNGEGVFIADAKAIGINSNSTYRFRYDDLENIYSMKSSDGIEIRDLQYILEIPHGAILWEIANYSNHEYKWEFFNNTGDKVDIKTFSSDREYLINSEEQEIAIAVLSSTKKSVKNTHMWIRPRFTIKSKSKEDYLLYTDTVKLKVKYKYHPYTSYDIEYKEEDGILYMKMGDEELTMPNAELEWFWE